MPLLFAVRNWNSGIFDCIFFGIVFDAVNISIKFLEEKNNPIEGIEEIDWKCREKKTIKKIFFKKFQKNESTKPLKDAKTEEKIRKT